MGFPELRSRHLGLVTADPTTCTHETLEAFEKAAEAYLDIKALLECAGKGQEAVPNLMSPSIPPAGVNASQSFNLAVARDEAFHFYYPDLLDELESRGARILFFSPLHDSTLPPEADALYLGGGYPEVFAKTLSENKTMLDSIRTFATRGGVIYAECGGLITLTQSIQTREGDEFPLVGLLSAKTVMTDQRIRLGYVEVTLKADSLWGKAGSVLRGHEFHYGKLLSDPSEGESSGWSTVYARRRQNGLLETDEGFQSANSRILASFVHLHLASQPEALDHFVDLCLQVPKINK
jgi:cobyrinic acid a,c-diamide synthase